MLSSSLREAVAAFTKASQDTSGAISAEILAAKLGTSPIAQPQLVDCIAKALLSTIEEQAQLLQKRAPDIFDSSEVPAISVDRYLRRLQAVFRCSESALIGALIILDRFLAGERAGQEPRQLTALNVHRLFLACLVVTVKYNEDMVYGNSHYARAGGIHVREVNRLERHLLCALDYGLRIQPEEFAQYEEALSFLMAPAPPAPCAVKPCEANRCAIEKLAPAAALRNSWRPGMDLEAPFLRVKLVLQQ